MNKILVVPLYLFVIGQIAFHDQANGSLITNAKGQIIGSKLLGQQFTRPEYFHGRPSVVGYDASSSGGSNIGPTNPQLLNGNGSQVTISAGTPVPTNGTPVPGQKNTYNVSGSYLGIKTYAQQFDDDKKDYTGTGLRAFHHFLECFLVREVVQPVPEPNPFFVLYC